MGVLILPRRSQQKPSDAALNLGHNLARGLKHYWPCLQASPYRWPDFVTGRLPTVTSPFANGGTVIGYGAGGPVVDVRDGLGFSTKVQFAHNMTGATAFTVGALVYIGPVVAGSQTGYAVQDSVTGGGGGFETSWKACTSGGLTPMVRVAVGPSYAAYCDMPAADVPLNEWLTFFFTGLSGSALNMCMGHWPSGRMVDLDSTLSGGRTGSWSLPSDDWTLFGFNAGGTQMANAYAWTGVWDRRLALAEMQALHEAPWQMLQVPSRRRFFFLSTGTPDIAHVASITGVEDSAGLSASKTIGPFTSQVGECVVIVGAIYKNTPASFASTAIDDSYGNTWHPIGSEYVPSPGGNQRVRKYYSILTAAGAGHTISMYSDVPTQFVILGERFMPTDPVTVIDGTPVEATISSNSTTWTSPSLTTGNARSAVIGWCITNNSRTLSATSPQTKGSSVESTGWYGGGLSYDIKTSIGTFTPEWTLGTADQGSVGAFAILPVGATVSGAKGLFAFWMGGAGAVSGGPAATFAATPTGTLATTGAITTDIKCAASITGALTCTGALTTDIKCAASITGALTSTGALTTSITAAASISGTLTDAGALTTDIKCAASITGTLTCTAALTTDITCAAAITGSLTDTGALTTNITCASAITGTLSCTADLVAGSGFQASITGALTCTGALSTDIQAAASIAGALSCTGALTTSIKLAASLTGTLSTSADLTATPSWAASITGALTCTGALTTDIPLGATLTGSLNVTGAVTTDIRLAASISGSLTASLQAITINFMEFTGVAGSTPTGSAISGSAPVATAVQGATARFVAVEGEI